MPFARYDRNGPQAAIRLGCSAIGLRPAVIIGVATVRRCSVIEIGRRFMVAAIGINGSFVFGAVFRPSSPRLNLANSSTSSRCDQGFSPVMLRAFAP